jgi:ABC-type phosphate/phosphonate transport system substrate-binding protein
MPHPRRSNICGRVTISARSSCVGFRLSAPNRSRSFWPHRSRSRRAMAVSHATAPTSWFVPTARSARWRILSGERSAGTVHHSQSGYNAIRYHLLRYERERRHAKLFAEWVGPLVTPRAVIDAVLAGRIDVGPVDSLVLDLLDRHDPATASRLRVVGSTVMTPNPPLVASCTVAPEIAHRLRTVLLACGRDPEMRPVLDMLALQGFAAVAPADYAVLLEQAAAFGADMPQA